MNFLLKWRFELLSPLAGVFLTLAFAPYNYSFLALISLVFVFYSWLDDSSFRVTLRAYLFGIGLFASGISWVYISIHDYGGAPAVGAVLLTIAVVCFWSLFPALTAYLSIKLCRQKNKLRLIWTIPFVWILIEYFRGYWFLNGFPWLQISYTLFDTPLQGYIPIIGGYGAGFLLAITASFIVAGLKKMVKARTVILFVIPFWLLGGYLQTIHWTEPMGKAINVSLVQGNIAQDQKWLPQNRIKTLLSYQKMTVQNWDSDVIIWPETSIPAYLSQVKEFYLDPLSAEAIKHNTDVIVSLPVRSKNNEFYNAVLALGKNKGRYYKNHLLPFGEYLPLQPLSGYILSLLNIRLGNFSSGGDDQKLLVAGGYSFATSICYEDAFSGESVRAMPEAAYLVNVTNDAWFGDSIEPHQHMQIAQMRALEVGRYLLRVTNTGVTAIVAPDGTIEKKAPQFTTTVLKGSILPMKGMTVFAQLGDGAIVLALGVCLLLLLFKSLKAE